MSLQVTAADASAYRCRLKRVSAAGKRRTPLMDSDQRVDFIQKLEASRQVEGALADAISYLTPMDPELPGGGQYFCGWCARHFVSQAVLAEHEASKTHKRRRKDVIAEGTNLDQEIISELAVGFTRETKKMRE